MHKRPTLALAALACSLALAMSGCSASPNTTSTTNGSRPLKIVAAFYPLQFVAEQVGGADVQVTNLTLPGTEPHDLELTPQQVASLATADVVLYQKGFQANVDKAIEQSGASHIIDVSQIVTLRTVSQEEAAEDHDHGEDHDEDGDHDHELAAGDIDPHQWLDPTNMVKITDAVAKDLSDVASAHAAEFADNAKKLDAQLGELDANYDSLKTCKRTDFITSHAAFGYLAERYGLTQIAISGLSPDAEPSPARIAEVQQLATEHGVTTIFYETLISPKVSQSIANDLHLTTDVLDPIEGITDQSRGTNYIDVMKSNLDALKKANECS